MNTTIHVYINLHCLLVCITLGFLPIIIHGALVKVFWGSCINDYIVAINFAELKFAV